MHLLPSGSMILSYIHKKRRPIAGRLLSYIVSSACAASWLFFKLEKTLVIAAKMAPIICQGLALDFLVIKSVVRSCLRFLELQLAGA